MNTEKETSTKLRGDVILAKFLVDSLNKKAKGDCGDYMWMLGQLKINNLNDVTMHRWLSALKRCISIIDDDRLFSATLAFSWYVSNSSVVNLYIEYLEDLVSSHPNYLHSVMYKLCSSLFCPDYANDIVYNNIHNAIQSVLSLFPRSHTNLLSVFETLAPYKGKEGKYHETFVRNSLHITSYFPDLKNDILRLIVLKMLQIDVETPHSTRDTDNDQVVTTVEEMQFDVDMETDMTTFNSMTEDKRSHSAMFSSLAPVYSSPTNSKDPKMESIDIMMTIMFEYIHSQCFDDKTGKVVLHSTINTYELLLRIFEQQILLTHGSSHVQFLLFTIASYDKSIPIHFLDFLWEKFQDANMAAVCRQACALYIAGFIARSKCVPLRYDLLSFPKYVLVWAPPQKIMFYIILLCIMITLTSNVKLCLTAMMDWIHQYMGLVSANNLRPDVTRHGPFYSLCQAVFYIVVFRHKQILESDNGHRFFIKLDFSKLILSKLNPLKVCLSTIVDMFASVTCKHEIAFCYAIIEQNKRLMLPITASSSDLDTSSSCYISNLSTFFPFDPYCLARSAKFVSCIYQNWEDSEDKEEHYFANYKPHKSSSLLDQSPSSYGSLILNLTTP